VTSEQSLRLVWAALLCAALPARADDAACPAQLDLQQAEARLAAYNYDLRLAAQAVDGARADLSTAGERPNPALSFNSTEYDTRKGLGPGDWLHKQSDTVLRLDQTIERGNKRGLRIEAAQAGLKAAQADFADQRRQSLMALRQAYYDLLLAQRRLEITREIDELQQQTLAAAERRHRAGDLAASDVARLRVEALKSNNDREAAEAAAATARGALAVLIGCAPAKAPVADGELPQPIAAITQDDDLANRPDLAAAAARAQQTERQLALAKAQRTRDISIGLQVEHYPTGVPTPRDGQLLAGIGFSVPLFLWHQYDGEIARASSDAEAGRLQFERTRAQAAAEVEAARQALAAASAAARRFHEAIAPQAQAAAEAIEYAYSHGAAPLTDLLDARRTLRQSRLDEAAAAHDYAVALAAWRAAVDRYTPPSP
jgi:cobalt-zinc-cadmium efflux system outer membrane protein